MVQNQMKITKVLNFHFYFMRKLFLLIIFSEVRQPVNNDIATLLNFLPPEKDISISSNQAQASFSPLLKNSSVVYQNNKKSALTLAQNSQTVLHNNQVLREAMLASNESQLNLLQQQQLLLSNNPQLQITNQALNLPNILNASFNSNSLKNANNPTIVRSNLKHKNINSSEAKKEEKNLSVLNSQALSIEKTRLNKTKTSHESIKTKQCKSKVQTKVNKVLHDTSQHSATIISNNQQYHVKNIIDNTNQNTKLNLNVSCNHSNEKHIINNPQVYTSRQIKNQNIKAVKDVSSLNMTNPVTPISKKSKNITKQYQQNFDQAQISPSNFINPGLISQPNYNPLDEYLLQTSQILNYSPNALANFSIPQIPSNLHHNMVKKRKSQSHLDTNQSVAHPNKKTITKSKNNISVKSLVKPNTSNNSSPTKLESHLKFQMHSPLQNYPRVNSEQTKKLSHKLTQQRQNQHKLNPQQFKNLKKKPQLHEKLTQQHQKLQKDLNGLFGEKQGIQNQQISALQFQQQPASFVMSPSNQAKTIGSTLHHQNSWQQQRSEKVSPVVEISSYPFSHQNSSLVNQTPVDSSIVTSLQHNNYLNSVSCINFFLNM